MTSAEYSKEWRDNNRERVAEYEKRRYLKAQTDPSIFLTEIYRSCKRSALKRKIEFNITKEYVRELLKESKGKCQMSGVTLSMKRNDINRASIDRIDSMKGYIKGNLQIVTAQVNLGMNAFKKEDFIRMCRAVVEKHKGSLYEYELSDTTEKCEEMILFGAGIEDFVE
jgi:hypothetical protein